MLPKEITSLQHPIVKEFVKLRTNRKFRYEKKSVVIAGKKQVQEATLLERVLILKDSPVATPAAKEVFFVTESILKKVTGLEAPEALAATTPMPSWQNLGKKRWILVLDGVADPGNMGTLLRTALALGWEGAFLTDRCVDPLNEKALRAAKGATFRLPLQMGSIETLLALKEETGHIGLIADIEGKPLSGLSPPDGCLLVLGNEASGVSRELKSSFTSVSIPMNQMESLNVAAAGAIIMYNILS